MTYIKKQNKKICQSKDKPRKFVAVLSVVGKVINFKCTRDLLTLKSLSAAVTFFFQNDHTI